MEEQNRKMIEYEQNKQQLYKAHMGSQFDVMMAVIKVDMKGTEEEKNRILLNRFYKFFSSEVKKISVSDGHFWPRREPDYSGDAFPVPTELMLFGVDFLSAKQVRAKFVGL